MPKVLRTELLAETFRSTTQYTECFNLSELLIALSWGENASFQYQNGDIIFFSMKGVKIEGEEACYTVNTIQCGTNETLDFAWMVLTAVSLFKTSTEHLEYNSIIDIEREHDNLLKASWTLANCQLRNEAAKAKSKKN